MQNLLSQPRYLENFNALLADKAASTNLIEATFSTKNKPQTHIFDIDGVLTDPNRELVPPQLIKQIITLLEKGDFVSFNTGRPVSWAIEKVLSPIAQNLRNPALLHNCVLCGEKGAVSLQIINNHAVVQEDSSLAVPRHVANAIRRYAKENQFLKYFTASEREKFKGLLVYDDAKLTMATIYITDQAGTETTRKELAERLKDPNISKAILADLQKICGDEVTIDQTQIAFDIQHHLTGKDLGVRKIIDLQKLDAKKITHSFTYGDSPSDLDMAKELARQGFPVEHIHVGEREIKAEVVGVSVYNAVRHLRISHSLAVHNSIIDRSKSEHGYHLMTAPEFKAGPVIINCFTNEIEGRPATRKNFVDYQTLLELLTPSQLDTFKSSMKGELKFAGKQELDLARKGFQAWIESGDYSNPLLGAHFGEAYSLASQKFLENMMGKVGIRNLRKDNNGKVMFDVVRVSFQAYKLFSQPGISSAMKDFCAVTGVAMIPVSRDGQIIMQLRSPSNGAWGRVPGAGIAGMLDAERDPKNPVPGAPREINNKTMFHRLHTEGKEEIGLETNQIINVEITGIADDGAKPHNEITAIGYTFLTAQEHIDCARANHKNAPEGDFHFSETAFTIPATSQDIRTFFEKVLCPLPTTHAAALISAGFEFCRSEGRDNGPRLAETWKNEMQQVVSNYYQRIDQEVTKYYSQNTIAFFKIPERFQVKFQEFVKSVDKHQLENIDFTGIEKYQTMIEKLNSSQREEALFVALAVSKGILPQRNLEGYAPDYWPEDQGLPLMEETLRDAGYLS